MEVYLDMLILENLVMNYIILWVTGKLTRESMSQLRLLFGAVIGTVYCAVMFFPSLRFLYTFIFKVILSVVLVAVVFYPLGFKKFLKTLAFFYLVSFAFGGAAFGLFYFSNSGAILSNGVFYLHNFSVMILVISTAIAYIVIKVSWSFVQAKVSKENMLILLNVELDNKSVNLKGLIDTANCLYDPITNNPVIVVELSAIKELLPYELQELFHKRKQDDLACIMGVIYNSSWINRFRLIPYNSLGKENGMLVGFKPDKINIESVNCNREVNNIVVGIYNKNLSRDNSYNALLHPQIINL